MPFKSQAQQKFAFATGQPWAKEWADKTNFKKLPKRVKHKGKVKKMDDPFGISKARTSRGEARYYAAGTGLSLGTGAIAGSAGARAAGHFVKASRLNQGADKLARKSGFMHDVAAQKRLRGADRSQVARFTQRGIYAAKASGRLATSANRATHIARSNLKTAAVAGSIAAGAGLVAHASGKRMDKFHAVGKSAFGIEYEEIEKAKHASGKVDFSVPKFGEAAASNKHIGSTQFVGPRKVPYANLVRGAKGAKRFARIVAKSAFGVEHEVSKTVLLPKPFKGLKKVKGPLKPMKPGANSRTDNTSAGGSV